MGTLAYAKAGCGQRTRRRAGAGVVPGPTVLGDVGILHAPLDATLGAVVNLVPKAQGAFEQVVDIASASATARRSCRAGATGSPREALGVAIRVIEKRRAVA